MSQPYPFPSHATWQGSFQDTSVNPVVTHYFDVVKNSYGGSLEADATIRVTPWSSPPQVVIQGNTTKPREFTVTALFYLQSQYDTFLAAVGHNGLLMVPRLSYPGQGQQPVAAFLVSAGWGKVDAATPSYDGTIDAGAIEAPLKFILTG